MYEQSTKIIMHHTYMNCTDLVILIVFKNIGRVKVQSFC